MNKKNNEEIIKDLLSDDELLKRVSQHADAIGHKKNNDKTSSHADQIEALSKTFDIPEQKVENIADSVYINQDKKLTLSDKLFQLISNHPKEFTLASLVLVIVFLGNILIDRTTGMAESRNKLEIPKYIEKDIAKQALKSDFYEITSSLYRVQLKQTEYRAEHDKFSNKLDSLGLKKKYFSNKIKKIKLSRGGVITLKLDKSFGDNVFVKYKPIDEMLKGNSSVDEWNDSRVPDDMLDDRQQERSLSRRITKWKCTTNFAIKVNGCKQKT